MLSIDATRLDLAREFKANPSGPHSAELRELLKLMRWEPVVGRFLVVQPTPDGPYHLARTNGLKGHPMELFPSPAYAWTRLTGHCSANAGDTTPASPYP